MTKDLLPADAFSTLPAIAPEAGFVTCRINGGLYGVPLEKAREMVIPGSPTPVPFAPPVVRGVLTLNGRMATVVDVRTALGLPPARASSLVGLAVEEDGNLYVLTVDEVGDLSGGHGAREPIRPLDIAAIVTPA